MQVQRQAAYYAKRCERLMDVARSERDLQRAELFHQMAQTYLELAKLTIEAAEAELDVDFGHVEYLTSPQEATHFLTQIAEYVDDKTVCP